MRTFLMARGFMVEVMMDDGQLAEKGHPTKNDIDKVLPNNPVYLQYTSSHMGVTNTFGLENLASKQEAFFYTTQV
ncbi:MULTISPECIES: hypothetical protein [Bizionia]|uniref:hypothetical protein n=1 Tax=Bizionia TaxID=283785 RepID=UPI0008059F31|nr:MULTISPECIES: hypothetical protein [Bizionia]OBX23668.1 hypothetical protein BAA08_03160 [Bizionia sp. APA-3]